MNNKGCHYAVVGRDTANGPIYKWICYCQTTSCQNQLANNTNYEFCEFNK